MSEILDRQNDKKAIRFLQASQYAGRKEKNVKYFQIFISIAVCIIGIFFRYASEIGINLDKEQQASMSNWLVVISGIVIILNIFFSIYTKRLHVESTNLLESYDNYVFGLPENYMIMRPISDITIDNYASKYEKKSARFLNHYFVTKKETNSKNCVFENRYNEFFNAYKTIANMKGLLQCIWISFFIAIVAISANFDDSFVNTLLNILIPSLSVITLIVGSWHNMLEDLRVLQTAITNLNSYKEKVSKKNNSTNLNSTILLRSVQDGLFAYRLRSFLIPEILVKLFVKKTKTVTFKEKTSSKKETNKKIVSKAETVKNIPVKSEKVKTEFTKKDTTKTRLTKSDATKKTPIQKEVVKTVSAKK